MTISHMLRLRVRLHAGSYRREADMALPAHSSLAEFLDELLALCAAPLPARPWQALTAGGQAIDASVPLSHTGLRDGDSLLLSPQQELSPPVLLDATEALTEETTRSSRGIPPLHLAHTTATASLLALVIILSRWVPLWAAFLPSFLAALLLTLWSRPLPGVIAAGTTCAGTAGFCWIYHGQPHEWLAYALLTGTLATMSALALLGFAARGIPARIIATTGTACFLLLTAVTAWFILRTPSGAAALTLLFGFFLILLSPRLATACAGLTPLRLPSAGQDLGVSDPPPPPPDKADQTQRRARRIYEGINLGVVLASCPALLLVGATAGDSTGVGFSAAVLCCYALVFTLHGLRHPHPVVLWSHLAAALSALSALAVLSTRAISAGSHLTVTLIVGLLCLAGISMPWWLPSVPTPEPTHVLWWERLESLAIAAVIPLCLHLAGLFAFIRGLSL
ncbi:type VII secretion integral membrane protein EccD [Corynebacterium oculi]|uniref:EccD-like transmembrane domain-containing protein n=1 Tax=Corynebacterium oculi TaxID=1544416 RepID=A0A0N8VZM1_9CORY|nr:type VII secretion integral membrane protein EccD [Corynebacterium oculi]KQB84282.1 hypothetical protein Cocul_01079 [Corynebacterium oculi]